MIYFYSIGLPLLILVVIPLIGMLFIPGPILWKTLFTKYKEDKWTRNGPSDNKDQEMLDMWNGGLKFIEENKDVCEELYVTTSDGLKIYGQYFDFGFNKAVIISSGRPETGIYSAFYASSYKKAKVNVMIYDTRAHGFSEGKVSGMGFQEREELLSLETWIHENKQINKIILHGICVGSSSSTFAMIDERKPDYVVGLVTDGLYYSMKETLYLRVKHCHGFPQVCVPYFGKKTKQIYGYDISKEGPFINVTKIKEPTLMMASKEDIFSLKERTQWLFDHLASKDKTLVWWEHGRHSHLKIVDEKLYDKSIKEFVDKL